MTRPKQPQVEWTTICARVTQVEENEIALACKRKGNEIEIPISKAQFMRAAILKESRRLNNA